MFSSEGRKIGGSTTHGFQRLLCGGGCGGGGCGGGTSHLSAVEPRLPTCDDAILCTDARQLGADTRAHRWTSVERLVQKNRTWRSRNLEDFFFVCVCGPTHFAAESLPSSFSFPPPPSLAPLSPRVMSWAWVQRGILEPLNPAGFPGNHVVSIIIIPPTHTQRERETQRLCKTGP